MNYKSKTRTVLIDIIKSQGITLLTIIFLGGVQYSNLNHLSKSVESMSAHIERLDKATSKIDVYDYRLTAVEQKFKEYEKLNTSEHKRFTSWLYVIDSQGSSKWTGRNIPNVILNAKIEDTSVHPK
jgi:hypothetical protein